MKVIEYKIAGAMLAGSGQGATEKPVNATVELPFSDSNLKRADAEALPGTVQVLEIPEASGTEDPVHQRLVLQDRATGKLYELYIEDGKLMKEAL